MVSRRILNLKLVLDQLLQRKRPHCVRPTCFYIPRFLPFALGHHRFPSKGKRVTPGGGEGGGAARGSKEFLLVGRRSENEARAEAWKRGVKGEGLNGRRG